MPDPITAAIGAGGSLLGGYMSGEAQKDAAGAASGAQLEASRLSIEESRRQFETIQKLLAPYVSAGAGALSAQQDLLGLSGADAKRRAISDISSGQEMQALSQQGRNSILQNAAATGGLRGGNAEAALAQFRPQLLNQLIQQRLSNLGGITSMGQNAAAGVGNAGQNSSNQIIGALQNSGAASAGAAMAAGQANAGMWNTIGSTTGTIAMLKALKAF